MFRFGHFSDLHFKYTNYDTNELREDLIKKLESIADNAPLDAILITGDLFYKGDTSETAQNAVKEYIKRLAQASHCDMEHVFICAGNHDLKRTRARANNLNNIIEEYHENNGNLSTADYYSMIYGATCTPFIEFCESITGKKETSIHRFIELSDVNLLMLNTSIFAGQTYPGQKDANASLEDTNLFICDEEFQKLKEEVKKLDINKLTIVMAHHSPECFEKKERARFEDFLNKLPCDLYLCGHIHAVSTKLIEHTTNSYQVSCGGPFKDKDEYNTPSFIIGEFDPHKKTINLQLLNYVNSWNLYNQARSPWIDGCFTNEIKRLEISTSDADKSQSSKTCASSQFTLTFPDIQERYKNFILSQASEIDLNGLPTNSEDIKRTYKLNQLFIPLHFECNDREEYPAYSKDLRIKDLLPSTQVFRRVLLAAPGSGKTTLIKWIAATCCSKDTGTSEEEKYVKNLQLFPILIRCRDISCEQPNIWKSILDTARQAEWLPDPQIETQLLLCASKHIDNGDAILLIDGLDEINEEKRRADFISHISAFLTEYNNVRAIITSRSNGYNIISNGAFSGIAQWYIQPLADEDISLLCRKWYDLVYSKNDENAKKATLLAERIIENGRIKALANNPLMLTTLLLVERRVGSLPNKRAGLYHEAIDVLLESWNSGVREEIDLDEAKYQLAYVAFCMMTDPSHRKLGRTQITRTELLRLLRDVRRDFNEYVYGIQDSISGFIKKVEQRSALLYKSGIIKAADGHEEPVYSFQHLTFEEYLAAYAVTVGCYPGATEKNRDGTILFNQLFNVEMLEVISLSAAIDVRCANNLTAELIRRSKTGLTDWQEIDSVRTLLLQFIADEVSINKPSVQDALKIIFTPSIPKKYIPLLRQILSGKFKNDLRDYFHKGDDNHHYNGILASLLDVLTIDSFSPAKHFLQKYNSTDETESRDAYFLLANSCWVYGSNVFNDISQAELSQIQQIIEAGLASDDSNVLSRTLEIMPFCIPGVWRSLKDISLYYNAMVKYINQTNTIPRILFYEYYSVSRFYNVEITPEAKLTDSALKKIIERNEFFMPFDESDYHEALSRFLFVTFTCIDSQEELIQVLYQQLLDKECIERDSIIWQIKTFIELIVNLIDSGTIDCIPECIRNNLKEFYKTGREIVSKQEVYNGLPANIKCISTKDFFQCLSQKFEDIEIRKRTETARSFNAQSDVDESDSYWIIKAMDEFAIVYTSGDSEIKIFIPQDGVTWDARDYLDVTIPMSYANNNLAYLLRRHEIEKITDNKNPPNVITPVNRIPSRGQ